MVYKTVCTVQGHMLAKCLSLLHQVLHTKRAYPRLFYLTPLGDTDGETAPLRLSFFLELWVLSLSLNFFLELFSFFLNIFLHFFNIIANFQFFLPNILILKIIVDKNAKKSFPQNEKLGFQKKVFKFEVIFLSFWSREELLPKA